MIFLCRAQKIVAGLGIAAALSACGSTGLSNELRPYVGRDIQALKARMGDPNGQRETTGDRVFVWSSDSDSIIATTPFTSGSSNEGMSYAGSTTRSGLMPVQFQCTIEVTVDAHNVIQDYQTEGSHAGCRHFQQMLGH